MSEQLRVVVPDQIWEVRHQIRMLPGVYLPARMLAIRMQDDGLALWSPVPLDDAVASAIEREGRVTLILAPNNYHHLYLRPAMERYPSAEVWAAPGLPGKRPTLALPNVLGPDAAPPWSAELKPIFLAGAPAMDETAFVHVRTRTLVLTDALFHLQQVEGPLSATVFRIMGSMGSPRQSRMWRGTVKDKAAMGASFSSVLREDFDRVVMAHGDIIASGGHAVMREATSWLPGIEPSVDGT